MSISAEQCRAARGLLDWKQTELAGKARVSPSTVRDFEAGRHVPHPSNLAAIQQAFEAAGVDFFAGRSGVRLRRKIAKEGEHG